MPKINLTDLSNLQNEVTATAAINNNNTLIEAAIDNSISRDGTQPNQMNSSLDMNSNQIINLPDASSDQEPVTYGQFINGVTSLDNGSVIDGEFIILSADDTILNGRVLTAGPSISLIDGGAGGNLVVSVSSSELNAIAGAGSDEDKLPYYDGTSSAALTDLTPFARTLLDDADAATARTTLGVGTGTGDLVASNNLSDIPDAEIARSNLGVTLDNVQGAPKKNYILNGAMMVSQQNGTTAGTTSFYYPVDMFTCVKAATTGAFSLAQVASVTPAGSPNRIRFTVTTADAVVDSTDLMNILTNIEGLRVADLQAGTASAKTITIQFGVKAPAGTYCVTVRNASSNRTYTSEYVISPGEANTDVVKSVTLTLDTTGTWSKTNTSGLVVSWTLMSGTSYHVPADTWTAGNFAATSNQFNIFSTLGNVFELFDVSITEGAVAPTFVVPDYVETLKLCQRYWSKSFNAEINPANAVDNSNYNAMAYSTAAVLSQRIYYPVKMRTTPTLTPYSSSSGTPVNGQWAWFNGTFVYGVTTSNAPNETGFSFNIATSGATLFGAYFCVGGWTADARL